ncbi:von Willebrand factor type A [Gemmatirosa kalamazoonensis]|uniref:von Willebrand factor type A n=2 Tax=Gemmatirosa kalamazoonensis TaxID=861299 RepID=W0RNL0_9BACT|nr:von Willebrand factor type A [Gemmatirosa kalamazoonensis]
MSRYLRRLVARGRRALPARPSPPRPVELASVRRRLELLATALHDRPIAIEAVRARRAAGLMWVLDRLRRRPDPALPSTDGVVVRLPPRLAITDPDAGLARYRLLALEQAERMARGTVAHLPTEQLERDLFLVAEGAAVDRALARGRTRAALAEARASALAERPPLELMPPMERRVEALLRDALADASAPNGPPPCPTAAESARWARETAARMAAADRDGALSYTGLPPVPLWGEPRLPEHDVVRPLVELSAREADADRGDSGDETAVGDEPVETATAAPDDPGDDDGTKQGPNVDRPSERSLQRGPALAPVGGLPRSATADARAVAEYPEWDASAGRYRPLATTVIQWRPAEGEGAWAQEELARHAAVVRRVRERFARLRAQRMRLHAQRSGDELDLEACVRAAVDRRMGRPIDDRLYVAVRPARRALAIALLVDVSGSTDVEVSKGRRVIDVEKTAVLLAGEALDALGDPYAVLAFSSRTAASVHVRVVKDFGERSADAVRRRLAGLAPEANTRLGAAVRHTTALLSRQPAGHRLMLLLSDGQPNDVDHYQEQYAIEDARQAILEARAAGVYPFCLTVDREAPDYLARIFGAAGYTIMRHPEQLPGALLEGVSQLLRG